MRALTWHGRRDVRVDEHPDPVIEDPTDAIVRVTSTAICGSDLHLYELFGPFLDEGDILGHEPMGIVEEVGPEVTELKVGDRVVGLDLVPERLARVRARDIEVLDVSELEDPGAAVRELTDGRGPDAVIDAVGMEAHGSPGAKLAHTLIGFLPDAIAEPMMDKA